MLRRHLALILALQFLVTPVTARAADPCPLPFQRVDRPPSPETLRPLWSAQTDETVVDAGGGQWEVHFTYPADGGSSGPSIVAVIDTWSCTDRGLAKVGRNAIQTFGDGSSVSWGEENYQGVLYPRTLAPGAQWDWSAVQWSGDPTDAAGSETWHAHVADVGRETVTWPDGAYDIDHLHVTTVTETTTFESDEYLAQPVS